MIDPIDSPPSPTVESRDARGRFRPGHQVSIQHGLTVDRVPAEFVHLRAELDAFVAGCLADEGVPPAEVSTRRRSLFEDLARLRRRIMQLDSAIESRGMFDGHGRLRATWLERLTTMVKQAAALDAQLGQARRSTAIPTLADFIGARAPQGPQSPFAQPGPTPVDQVNPEPFQESHVMNSGRAIFIGQMDDYSPIGIGADLYRFNSDRFTATLEPRGFDDVPYAPVDSHPAAMAIITIEGAAILYSVDGDTAAELMEVMAPNVTCFLCNLDAIRKFRAVRAGADAAAVSVAYYRPLRAPVVAAPAVTEAPAPAEVTG